MISKKKIALFGCKSNTKFTLDALLNLGLNPVLISLDPEKGKQEKVADYADLKEYCQSKNLTIYIVEKYNLKSNRDEAFFYDNKFDLAFVNGWQRLIPPTILDTFSIGVFGMHGSAEDLPKGRGRSPLNWAILEGRKEFYANLFKYKAGTDNGDILDTKKFYISENDTAETMHFKNTLAMSFLIEKNIKRLLKNDFDLKKQPSTTPTYYPKRNETDSLIDWSKTIKEIEQFIKAVTKPFNGAYSFIEGHKIIIYRAHQFDSTDFGFHTSSNGEIVCVFPNNKFLVKVKDRLLLVHEYESNSKLKPGQYFTNGTEKIHHFKKNENGFHDLE